MDDVTTSRLMTHALALAWKGWGRVHPNPMVGALVVRDGRVIGEGWHAEYGGPHAEVAALRAAGQGARGATVVVTLEPCRHQGKQPPCTESLFQAGVREVVIGAADPDPAAAGGADRLRKAGVTVRRAPFEAAVRAQNAAFFHRHTGPSRPWIALKLALSLDGAIADRSGRSRWVSGPEARAWVHRLRAGFDAIAVGGRTARADDPQLTVRGDIVPRIAPRRVVFSTTGKLDPASRLVRTSDEVPVTLVTTPGSRVPRLPESVSLLRAAALSEAMTALHARGVTSLLVEGGGQLAATLLQAGLVDRFYAVIAPRLLGRDAVPGLPTVGLEAEGWAVIERGALGPDTLIVMEPPRAGGGRGV